jgi:lipid II:glycine glycyltransferase (peptidoglycan interpeptide bridge formation enzyme)
LLEWKQAHLAVCIKDDEPVAAAIFLVGSEVVEYLLSASSQAGKRLGGTNLLIHEAAQAARSKGCRALYLGGGTDDQPDNPLLFFKAGFSAERAEFKIGKHVHSDEGDMSLREQFSEAYEAHPGRVLFYR